MFRYLKSVREWIYPPQKQVMTVIDTAKPYVANETNKQAIMEKVGAFKQHYSTYKLNDGVLAASMVGFNVLLYAIGTGGFLITIADATFVLYGAAWFREEYRKEHDNKLNELMAIYKWMAVGQSPSITKVEQVNGVDKQNLHLEVLTVLAAFYNADRLNVGWAEGSFSEQYWQIMRAPPHYKTPALHASSAVEPNATALVALSKVVVRHSLYAPSKTVASNEQVSTQVGTPITQAQQADVYTLFIATGNMALTFFERIKTQITPTPSPSAALTVADPGTPRKNH